MSETTNAKPTDAKPTDAVSQVLNGAAPSESANTVDSIRQRILDRYDRFSESERETVLANGADAYQLVELALSAIREQPDCPEARARSTGWIETQIANRRGVTVSADEWIAVYQLVELGKPITPAIESPALALGALRVLRRLIGRRFEPITNADGLVTGYREEWFLRDRRAEILRVACENQAAGAWNLTDPNGAEYQGRMTSAQLTLWCLEQELAIDRAHAEALPDGADKTKLLALLDKREKELANKLAGVKPDKAAPIVDPSKLRFEDWNAIAKGIHPDQARALVAVLRLMNRADVLDTLATELRAQLGNASQQTNNVQVQPARNAIPSVTRTINDPAAMMADPLAVSA